MGGALTGLSAGREAQSMTGNRGPTPFFIRAVAIWFSVLTVVGCGGPQSESLRFRHGATEVEVTFHGEIDDQTLFGPTASLIDHVRPLDEAGNPRGRPLEARPGWLHFEYRVGGETRELLVARRPLMNHASWDDIARAGAALDGGAPVASVGTPVPQDAQLTDLQGRRYRVRLLRCGQSTTAELSEWNLLIGAVHRGDMDFTGDRYGWIRAPYDDQDLRVGYQGSLTWCQDEWRGDRVARGYFFVSRFHAAEPELRTDRLAWRPVLERVTGDAVLPSSAGSGDDANGAVVLSPTRHVAYAGRIRNADLFGTNGGIEHQLSLEDGRYTTADPPDWLHFRFKGKTLLIAARPIKHSVSWNAIAQAGAATGDGSLVRIGWRLFRQNAEVEDVRGRRYRVRLIGCGRSTLDPDSEWNALIGGVHRGDGDFLTHPGGLYGWLDPPFDDADLGIGTANGSATWCRERLDIDGKSHAVNRGFLTVSRFHATAAAFAGWGFGWRPVLEPISDDNRNRRRE
ncbi:MAG TPA: hypothetical protein PL143_18605 [Rhodocyclaceae bacterium]|nr:hypothetical protein [Rhodocyclaceae bacterium]